jgi:hypothetical protein
MNEERAHTCPICKLTDNRIVRENGGALSQLIRVNCPRCKKFIISDVVEDTTIDEWFGPKVSAWIRDRNEQHAEVPKLTTDSLKELQAGLPNYGPREKQIRLLQNIERKT